MDFLLVYLPHTVLMRFLKADLLYKIFLLNIETDITKILDHLCEIFFVMMNNGIDGMLLFDSVHVISYAIY